MSHAAFWTRKTNLVHTQSRASFLSICNLRTPSLTYITSFVKGLQDQVCELEHKVQDLEQKLAEYENSQLRLDAAVDPALSVMNMQPSPISMHPTPIDFFNCSPATVFQSHQESTVAVSPEPPSSLAQELKELSLQAAAERHLGNSSGLSFAKLTQLVLSRLSPDKAEFVFESPPPPYRAHSPPLALESVLDEFSTSVSFFPTTMFTGTLLSDMTETADVLALRLPEEPRLSNLVDFYFAHSHTLYPIINRQEFVSTLDQFRRNPDDPWASSPLSLFRIWIVLAIGATTHCSVTLNEESEPMSYYNKAMLYFEAALGYGEMVTLEVLMLQVSYSFFNQLGPNTWFLIGVAARVAVGMGLHASQTYEIVPVETAERQKRLFFSVYMMDRLVSMSLGRPSAIHDDDIDVTPFVAVDEENIPADGFKSQNTLQPSALAIPLHILALRKIASKIQRIVYCSTTARNRSPEERATIIQVLHKELIEWRRNMPFPLPDSHPQVPQMSTSWYDFNFYTHLTFLYRPSPLSPTLDEQRVKILADAASMSIRQALNMHRQQRFAYNWLNLLSVFTVTLSLVYATTASPHSLASVLKGSKAIQDLEAAMELFDIMSVKFPAAKKIGGMVQQIVIRYRDICNCS